MKNSINNSTYSSEFVKKYQEPFAVQVLEDRRREIENDLRHAIGVCLGLFEVPADQKDLFSFRKLQSVDDQRTINGVPLEMPLYFFPGSNEYVWGHEDLDVEEIAEMNETIQNIIRKLEVLLDQGVAPHHEDWSRNLMEVQAWQELQK